MLKKIVSVLALAGLFVAAATNSRAETISQNFAGSPLTNGWFVFGDSSHFVWNPTSQNLQVTWDSSHTNSYFYHPLGTTVSRYDDFQIEFDLKLDECVSGNEPGKTGPLQIGIGLVNLAVVTNSSYGRGIYGGTPNIAEFNYFPYGYYTFGQDIFVSDPTTVADFVSSSGFGYAPTFFDPFFEFALPTNQPVHVAMKFTAKNQSLSLTLTTNNVVCYHPPDVVLNGPASGFTTNDNFLVDTFSISSYSSYGDDFDSVLGHGTVDNLFINIPPVQDFTGAFSDGLWQAQFRSRTNWSYVLERTLDFSLWTNVSPNVAGNATNLILQDTNPPIAKAFYRVRATQP